MPTPTYPELHDRAFLLRHQHTPRRVIAAELGCSYKTVLHAFEAADIRLPRGRPPAVFIGERYGMLTVIEPADSDSPRGLRKFLCRCDCGNDKIVKSHDLRVGATVSCGCSHRTSGVFAKRHRKSKSRAYRSWALMKQRCTNPNSTNYALYGGRGIKVCERWEGPHGSENFLADMGERPEGHTLDRIDPDGDYSPMNCRWATHKEQSQNQRDPGGWKTRRANSRL